jgi:sugar phosphate isomerase/epimerase
MKRSMHNCTQPEPVEVTLERLHRFGYDGIEISGEPTRYVTDEVRRLMDQYQLECWGSVTMMFEGRDLIHPDAGIRRESVQYIKDSLDMTKRLSGRISASSRRRSARHAHSPRCRKNGPGRSPG